MASKKAEGMTLEEAVKALKCRKGPSAGITKRGAYWLAARPVLIRRFGGDGVGNNAADRRIFMEVRHFRDGHVRFTLHEDALHENGTYGGAGDWWTTVELGGCRTAEEIKVILSGATVSATEHGAYSNHYSDNIDGLAASFGLPISMPAPDEEPAGAKA